MSSHAVEVTSALTLWLESEGKKAKLPSQDLLDSAASSLAARGDTSDERGRPLNDTDVSAASLVCAQLSVVETASTEILQKATSLFRAIEGRQFPGDEFGELTEVLCTLAFIAWRHARGLGRSGECHEWLETFDRHFSNASVERECIEYFMAAQAVERSDGLANSFLLDARTLFAICSLLREKRFAPPRVILQQTEAIRDWVERQMFPDCFEDEREYFLAQLEYAAATCARWLGQRDRCLALLDRAEARYTQTSEPDSGRAEIMFMRVAILYDRYEMKEALGLIGDLQAKLLMLRMETLYTKSQLLNGAILKSLGRIDEAAAILALCLRSPVARRIRWL